MQKLVENFAKEWPCLAMPANGKAQCERTLSSPSPAVDGIEDLRIMETFIALYNIRNVIQMSVREPSL